MKRAYFMNSYAPGYGPRIFVPYELVEDAAPILNPLSCWGGTDKDTGLAKGWEFSARNWGTSGPSTYSQAIQALADAGYKVEGLGQHNADQVWK